MQLCGGVGQVQARHTINLLGAGVTLISGVFNGLCHTAQNPAPRQQLRGWPVPFKNPVLSLERDFGIHQRIFSKVLARRSAHRSWPYAEDDRLCGGAYNGRVLDDLL